MAKVSSFSAIRPSNARSALLPLLLLFLPLLPSSSAVSDSAQSVWDLLQAHGLPAGILPRAVKSFAYDPSSGLLEVRIGRVCYVRYDNGLAYFDREVRGNLSYGAIDGVVGWEQEELFIWVPVKGITVVDPTSGVILFDIGFAHKSLPLASFENPPECISRGNVAAVAGFELLGRRGWHQQATTAATSE